MNNDTIELRIDESNEVVFKVSIQGANESPTFVRFVCEGAESAFLFNGTITEDGEATVIIPPMKGKISENEVFQGKLEILVEGRYFVPLEVNTKFKQPFNVVAESVQVKSAVMKAPVVSASVSAKPVVRQPAVTSARPVPAPPKQRAPIVETVVKESPAKDSIVSDAMVQSIIRKLNLR